MYVGVTSNLKKRLIGHLKYATSGSQLISAAVKKYGLPEVKILYVVKTFEEAYGLEIVEIARLGTLAPNGYNLTKGGEGGTGTRGSDRNKDISRQRRSKAARKRWADATPDQRREWLDNMRAGRDSRDAVKPVEVFYV